MPIIDADAHVVETEQTWSYLEGSEKKYQPTTKLMTDWSGPANEVWVLGDHVLGSKFNAATEERAEVHQERFGRRVATPQESREMSDVSQRLADMDKLQIDTQVLHNSFFIGPTTNRPEVEIALTGSWNRWMADIWKQGNDRLRWSCVVPWQSPKEAIPQMQFAKENGAVAVCMRPFDQDRWMTDPFYYPIYEAAEKLGLPIGVHLANANPFMHKFLFNEIGRGFAQFRIPTVISCFTLILSEIPKTFPNLKWGFIEVTCQWVPWVLHEAVHRSAADGSELPENPIRDFGIYVSTQTDDDFDYVISYIGDDNLMIGTDYGHNDPSSDLDAISIFRGQATPNEKSKKKILYDNPKAFYNL